MTPEARAHLLGRVETLPVLPHVVARALQLDPAAETYFDDVVALIESEPNYAVRLVAAANSVVARGVTPITRIRDAVVRLGAREVCSLVVSLSVVRVFVPRADWEKGLWLHALEAGHVARALARHHGSGLDGERAFLSGLLHDVGRFIMFDAAPESLKEVDEASWVTPASLLEAERAICGVDHAALGAEVAARWGLPTELVEFLRHHHSPEVEGVLPGVDGRVARLVQVADASAFSAVSTRHQLVQFRALRGPDAEVFLRNKLPSWFSKTPGAAQAIMEALTRADTLARTLGLAPLGHGTK